ncbi:MAG TPA: insulinase family protein, partial [Bacteroidia bacterium]|nr:insulinase family protein [Bacteroidia bacterium]
NISYRFDMGSWNNRLLPIAADYLKYLGTDKSSSSQLTQAFYNIACEYKINVTGDQTIITISGLQENFNQALKLFENVIYNCKPDENTLTIFKERLVKTRENSKLNKTAIMRGVLQYAIYGPENPYNYQLNSEDLSNLKASDLTDLLHRLLHYPHIVGYYGPVPENQAETAILNAHSLPLSFSPIPAGKTFTKAVQSANQVLFVNYDMVQAEVYWVRNTGDYNPEETPTIKVFNNYFGVGMASIVFQTIRESKALAYSTFAQYNQPLKKEERYSDYAYVGAQADKMKDAIAGMNDLLNNLPENPALLANTQESIRQDIATERIPAEEYIDHFLANQKLGLTDD